MSSQTSAKVEVLWEGHKVLQNHHFRFDVYYIQSNLRWRFLKILWPSQNVWTLSKLGSLNIRTIPFHIGEGVSTSYIIHNNDPMCSSVISWCDSSKSFLSCSVPNLKLHSFSIQFDCANFKVHSNCGDIVARKLIICKSHQKWAFPHSRVTYDKEFFLNLQCFAI